MRPKIAVLLLLLPSLWSQSDPTTSLRGVLQQQTDAWNRGDLEAFMAQYWHSPELTFFSGDTILKGWDATLDRYRKKYLQDGRHMGQLSFTDETIQLLAPDAALVTARWHLALPDSRRLEGLTTVLCKRFPDGWKIVHDHSS